MLPRESGRDLNFTVTSAKKELQRLILRLIQAPRWVPRSMQKPKVRQASQSEDESIRHWQALKLMQGGL
jgi:hypothetical protein